ncbi:hypothetical protein GIB67_009293 [Kingdonia uniflora]|uniref:Uncharacterized protein n=1 Tax=Kingdonia uniflora TaxID=39325 RepID=A0A7J7N2X9_9MAGN|nr:hypothetical protein GIB67_009293 [Kingdonia uniflora]
MEIRFSYSSISEEKSIPWSLVICMASRRCGSLITDANAMYSRGALCALDRQNCRIQQYDNGIRVMKIWYTMKEKVPLTASNIRKRELDRADLEYSDFRDLVTNKRNRKRKTVETATVSDSTQVALEAQSTLPIDCDVNIDSAEKNYERSAGYNCDGEGAANNEELGPIDTSLLRSFKFHRARSIVLGKEKVRLRVYHYPLAWDLANEPQKGEMTQTLDDVEQLIGFGVDGDTIVIGGTWGFPALLEKLREHYAYKLEKVLSDGTAVSDKKKGLTASERSKAQFDVEAMKIVWAGSQQLDVSEQIARLVSSDPAFRKDNRTTLSSKELFKNTLRKAAHGLEVWLQSFDDHSPLPGIIVADIGMKFRNEAYNTMGNDVLRFDHVCIPRDQMLMQVSQVTREGKYVQSDVPRQLLYGTMVYVQQTIVADASCALSRASLTTSTTADAILECRKLCSGHGYLCSSGLPELFVVYVPACTFEGDNVVLLLQVARFLMKAVSQLESGKQLVGTTAYMGRVEHLLQCCSDVQQAEDWLKPIAILEQHCNKLSIEFELF